ncbi:Met-10+ like-protein-domain-containing protein [Cladorrhinum sp. PSN332]|nr:Met-10+ like-protein-domain-containing protein [Cladorrhinum sp. PSN332]
MDSQNANDTDIMSLFRPPIVRSGTAALNRALFTKKVDLAAAALKDPRLISQYRKSLSTHKELLSLERISPIRPHPDQALDKLGHKCLLLKPDVKLGVPETYGPGLKEGIQKEDLTVIPYELEIGYDYWTTRDVLESILPESLHDEIPTGFNTAGHVAHLNLREDYIDYKQLVAQVIMDKNPHIKTVINKVDNVGSESEFRTFKYEVLAGKDDLQVQVNQHNCSFEFDYSKVYWNSKLETEHSRTASMFSPGEVVCDVMAGIGPFAVPSGKKGVFVWANDKNPESFKCLDAAIKKNKVSQYVTPSCSDGHDFIKQSADIVLEASHQKKYATIYPKRAKNDKSKEPLPPTHIYVPPTISHFVMNLPAIAIEFIGSYRGIYHGHEDLFEPTTDKKLPMVHVHCFSFKAQDETPINDICERVTKYLGYPMKPGNPENEGEVSIHNVRNVAPAKSMYCASFRIPREVAFAERS